MSERLERFADDGGDDYRGLYRESIRQELQSKVEELRRIHADLERIVDEMQHEIEGK